MIIHRQLGLLTTLVLLISLSSLCFGNHRSGATTAIDTPLAEIQTIVIINGPQLEAPNVNDVSIKRVGSVEVEAAKVGMKLYANDEIKTGENTRVTLVFTKPDADDRIEVMLKENSSAKISSIFGYYGRFFISGFGLFDTQTNYVRLGKRGTEFEVSIADNGDVELNVLRGEVDVEKLEPVALSHHLKKVQGKTIRQLRVREVRTVPTLSHFTIAKDQPLQLPRPLQSKELDDALTWTNKLIIASFPSEPPRNIIPTALTDTNNSAGAIDTFIAARKKATLEPTADNVKVLGDIYKDLGDGKKSLVEYAEAVKVKPDIKDSAVFLANHAEAYRLAGNLEKADVLVKEASARLSVEPEAEQLVLNVSGNVHYDQAIESIVKGKGRSANDYFKQSQRAYQEAQSKAVNDENSAILHYNLRNVKLAFGPTYTINTATACLKCDLPLPGPDLTGTYRGIVDFPGESLQGPSVLVVTGNRFSLVSCNDSLTGSLLTRKGDNRETFVDLVFDSIEGVKKLFLKAIPFSTKRIRLTSAAGEKYHFDFSSQFAQPQTLPCSQ